LAGKKIALPEMFRIGRGSHSDLVLPDEAASRNHATIEVTAAGLHPHRPRQHQRRHR